MKFFSPDSKIFQMLTDVFDLVLLNFLFMLTCLPVVTIGAAISSLYKMTSNLTEHKGGKITAEYFAAFKSNFKKATPAWIIDAIVLALLYFDIWYWYKAGSGNLRLGMIIFSVAVLVIVLLKFQWVYPIISMFENNVKSTMFNGFLFGIRYLLPTVIMVALTLGFWFILLYLEVTLPLLILFGFSLPVYIKSFYVFKKLKVYADPQYAEKREEVKKERVFVDESDQF